LDRLDADHAIVYVDDRFGDREPQPETGTPPCRIGSVKTFEDMFDVLFGDAASLILDLDSRASISCFNGDANRMVRWCKLQRVIKQNHQQPPERERIHLNSPSTILDLHF